MQTVTALVMVVVIVGLALYDLIAYSRHGSEATISRVTYWTSVRSRFFLILFVFAMGVLFGHLFLPQHIDTPIMR